MVRARVEEFQRALSQRYKTIYERVSSIDAKVQETPVPNGETNNSIFKRAVDPWTDDGSHFGTFDNRRSSITERSYGSEVCIWAPGEGDETG